MEIPSEFLNDARTGFILCLLGIFLCLAWIFSSWTRPIVVMAIIPFGLVGAFYGHVQWEVPLSMFSVVGLIGMTGIIINDSIVLVTTVDEYAKERGLIPAIIDGACDRFRAVSLTTLTTVLGLAPLLYEQSQQAQFLKPTVITLVYGLGFGMVLVLLVVPALMAMQQDVNKQIGALRRALRGRRGGRSVTAATLFAVMGVAALFAGTLGSVIVTGALPVHLLDYLPETWGAQIPTVPVDAPVLSLALGLFLVGATVLILAIYVVSVALVSVFGGRKTESAKAA